MSRTSRPRTVATTGLTLGFAAASLFLAPAAFAAGSLPDLTVPESVAAGSTLTFSGEQCLPTKEGQPANVIVFVGPSDAESLDEVVQIAGTPDAAGKWKAVVPVAAEAPLGEYTIDATCEPYAGAKDFAEYEWATFQVVAAAAPSTAAPTTAAPSSTAPAEFKPGARPNTPGVASTSTAKTTGAAAAPGQKVVKVLKGFKPGEKVTVVLHSAPVEVATAIADANGVVTIEFTVPAGTPLGNHTLTYTGSEGTYFEEPLQLTADGKALAYTGASIALPLTLGAGLLAVGGGVLVATRRRSSGASQA